MADTATREVRVIASPTPEFTRRHRRSMWTSTRVTYKKYGRKATKVARKASVQSKKAGRTVVRRSRVFGRSIVRTTRRFGRWSWGRIKFLPKMAYRGLGYVARGASFLIGGLLSTTGLLFLGGAIILGSVAYYAYKSERGWRRRVHRRTRKMSRGHSVFDRGVYTKRTVRDQLDDEVIDYSGSSETLIADDEGKVIGKIVDNEIIDIADGVEEKIGNIVQGEVVEPKKVYKENGPRVFTPEISEDDPNKYPVLVRQYVDDEKVIEEEADYDAIDAAVHDALGRKDLYNDLLQMETDQVDQMWKTMVEIARFRGDNQRGSYWFGRSMACGFFMENPAEFMAKKPQEMADLIAVPFEAPEGVIPDASIYHVPQIKAGARHEAARIHEQHSRRTVRR